MRTGIASLLRRAAYAAGTLGVFGASISGCGGGGGSSHGTLPGSLVPLVLNSGIFLPAVPGTLAARSACAANPHQGSSTARWTVLVYMNASNNLQPFSLLNIAQMVSVGSDSNVNIVVQWKQSPASEITDCADCTPSFVGTRRYILHQHPTAGLCTDINDFTTCSTNDPNAVLGAADELPPPSNVTIFDPTANVTTTDAGDYRVLADFVTWGETHYPADNYALVVWDHGSGWRPVYRAAARRSATRAVSQDEATGNEIETQEIQTALTGIPHPLDMVIFDCSLEGMIEVAYQIKSNAKTMVCSEESPPGAGYPYHLWLAGLKASGKNACDVGTTIVQDFVNYYPAATDTTQSLIDLSQMQNVATNLNAFGGALYSDRMAEANLIANARNSTYVQSYGTEDLSLYAGFVDLYGYAANMKTATTVSAVSTAALNLESSLTNPTTGAILYAGYGPQKVGSNGLSVYVPAPGNYLSAYSSLALSAAAPSWPQFLQAQAK